MPALLGLHHPEALFAAPVEVVGGIALGPQADLHHPVAVQQAFFHGAAEGGAMGDLLAEHVLVDVGMGIHVHQADLAVFLLHGPQDGQRQGVVAAQGEGGDIVLQHPVVVLLDQPHRVQHHRFAAQLPRPEAGAGAQRGTDVQGDADEGGVESGRGSEVGQPQHAGDAAEAGHLVAAQRLVQDLFHGSSSLC